MKEKGKKKKLSHFFRQLKRRRSINVRKANDNSNVIFAQTHLHIHVLLVTLLREEKRELLKEGDSICETKKGEKKKQESHVFMFFRKDVKTTSKSTVPTSHKKKKVALHPSAASSLATVK